MPITVTIVPIFIVILMGWVFHRRGFIPQEFLAPANRLIFYLAIPALMFRSIARSGFREWFNPALLYATLGVAVIGYAGSWAISRAFRLSARQTGTFIQTSGHGNLGYIGLAVAYYHLGDAGLAQASVLAGFLMIMQNFLSIVALQLHGSTLQRRHRILHLAGKVFGHPVILSALSGIAVAAGGWRLPVVVDRSLDIIRSMALPTALLLIGASLTFQSIFRQLKLAMSASAIKLVLMPVCGIAAYRLLGFSGAELVPGLILLAAPSATVAYVMAHEMGGDVELAVATISASTLLSAVTYTLLLSFIPK